MRVKLKVLSGGSSGKELAVDGPRFLIGRAEECNLRPRSDAVSRRHCVLLVDQERVVIRDLGSRNGTYVNGDRVDGECPISTGDQLRVGPLEFLVLFHQERAQVAAKEGPGRAALSDSGIISQWLEEADAVDRDERMIDPETRQFKLDETDRVALEMANEETKVSQQEAQLTAEPKNKGKKGKAEPGKLPPKPAGPTTRNTQEAAAEMLKKLFNRT